MIYLISIQMHLIQFKSKFNRNFGATREHSANSNHSPRLFSNSFTQRDAIERARGWSESVLRSAIPLYLARRLAAAGRPFRGGAVIKRSAMPGARATRGNYFQRVKRTIGVPRSVSDAVACRVLRRVPYAFFPVAARESARTNPGTNPLSCRRRRLSSGETRISRRTMRPIFIEWRLYSDAVILYIHGDPPESPRTKSAVSVGSFRFVSFHFPECVHPSSAPHLSPPPLPPDECVCEIILREIFNGHIMSLSRRRLDYAFTIERSLPLLALLASVIIICVPAVSGE